MRRVVSLALAVTLTLGATAPAALADWGAFYLGSAPAGPRMQVAAPSDRTGMHPQNNRRDTLRLSAPVAIAEPLRPYAGGTVDGDPASQCVTEILRAQDRYGIPDNILLGIGLQEAGVSRGGRLTVWPWAVNAAGVGRIFDNRAAAMAWVREREAMGVKSIDVGCMQINLRWHPHAFANLEQGFDPVINVDYAARFLRDLYAETGDWMRAAGAYHSRTPAHAEVYLASLRRNVAVANDRIDAFHGMAGAGQMAGRQTTDHDNAAVPEHLLTALPVPDFVPAAWDHGHWSTRDDQAGGSYGIYSQDRLEPVLPQFLQDF